MFELLSISHLQPANVSEGMSVMNLCLNRLTASH